MSLLVQVGFFASHLAQTVLPFLFVLLLVVFFHELGHFLVGRLCGVRIDSFSIGFGPELFAFVDRHGTRWRCAMIPLGGYVKFHGDLNGASVPDANAQAAMPETERAVSFFGQNVAKRAAIVAAGPIASFLFAIVVFAGTIYVNGSRDILPRVQTVAPNTAAAAAGFKPGDLILSVNGTAVDSFFDLKAIITASHGAPTHFTVNRAGATVDIIATPRSEVVDVPVRHTEWRIGLPPSQDPKDVRVVSVSPGAALTHGASQTWEILKQTTLFIGRMFRGHESADQMSGPIGIATMSGEMFKLGLPTLFNWAAFLSASIGFFNLIPIPLLDGGHLLYFAIEAVRGKPLSLRAQEVGFRIGLAIVAMLMVFATYNDVSKLFL